MSAYVAVMTREIRERWFVFIAALAFALLPLVVGLLPFAGGTAEKITTLSGVLATPLALGLAVALGTSVIGRDLTSGKLSFYFSRPLGAASIWFGKLSASVVLIVCAFFIAFAPVFFVQRTWMNTWNVELTAFSASVMAGSVVLMLVSHVLSTVVRSRSWLIGVDFALFMIAALIFAAAVWPLVASFAMRAAGAVASMALIAAVCAIVPAGLWQLARGRADRFRSHVAMSTFLWASVAVIMVAAAAWSLWIRSAAPSDVREPYGIRASSAGIVFLGGEAADRFDYNATFVGDPLTGKYVAARPTIAYGGGDVSADGSMLVEARPASANAMLMALFGGRKRLEQHGLELVVSPTFDPSAARSLGAFDFSSDLAISSDGKRVAVLAKDNMLSVYDASSTRLLYAGKMPLPDRSFRQIGFVSNDLLRVFATRRTEDKSGPMEIEVAEVMVPAKRVVKLPSIAAWGWTSRVYQAANGEVLVWTLRRAIDTVIPADAPPAVRVLDPRTSAVRIAINPALPANRTGVPRLLRNGGVLVTERTATATAVRFFDPRGVEERRVELPKSEFIHVNAELPDGRVVVALSKGGPSAAKRVQSTLAAVVSRDGSVQTKAGLMPLPTDWWTGESRLSSPVVPCFDDRMNVVRWNAATGAVEPVVWKKV